MRREQSDLSIPIKSHFDCRSYRLESRENHLYEMKFILRNDSTIG